MGSRREKVRQAAIDEIKSIAWETTRENGIEAVSVNGIARRMGMTPPAFYSYFKSRNELIQTLVIDALQSFRVALIEARETIPDSDSAGRIYHVYIAYREWAVENPNMFGIFAGRPVYGFKSQDQKIMGEAGKVYDIFLQLHEEAWKAGVIRPPKTRKDLPASYAAAIKNTCERGNLSLPKEAFNLLFRNVLLIHGMISMELSGRFSDSISDYSAFYRFQIVDMLKDLGIQVKHETNC
jgi:AcrR family transcriptional regulator